MQNPNKAVEFQQNRWTFMHKIREKYKLAPQEKILNYCIFEPMQPQSSGSLEPTNDQLPTSVAS